VVIPRLIRGEELDETDSSLHEAPSQEATRSELCGCWVIESVESLGRLGFGADIEGFFCCRLQSGGEGVALDSRVEIGFACVGLCVRAVEIFEVGEVVLLRDAAQVWCWVEIGDTGLL